MSHRPAETNAPANPFCTRCIRPGAIPYRFCAAESTAGLIDRFQLAGWRGAIVGPHGSGKSTLLATLLPGLNSHGLSVAPLVLHDGQRRLPPDFVATLPAPGVSAHKGSSPSNSPEKTACANPRGRLRPETIVVVDGYEQLGLFSRCRLRWLCWRRRLGLLVTSHSPVGLPELHRTVITLALAQRVVAELQEGFEVRISPDDVARLYPQYRGNLRELLFKLFDLYQSRRRKG